MHDGRAPDRAVEPKNHGEGREAGDHRRHIRRAGRLGRLRRRGRCQEILQREEGEAQAKAALARHENLERIAITPDEIGGYEKAVTRDGDLRTLPSMLGEKGGMDGFFAARFRWNG